MHQVFISIDIHKVKRPLEQISLVCKLHQDENGARANELVIDRCVQCTYGISFATALFYSLNCSQTGFKNLLFKVPNNLFC